MRGPIGSQLAGLSQRPRVAPIGLYPATPGRVHRREVRVGDDHLVPELLLAAGDPRALCWRLEQNLRFGAPSEDLRKSNPVRQDPLLDPFAAPLESADLALILVDADAGLGEKRMRSLGPSGRFTRRGA